VIVIIIIGNRNKYVTMIHSPNGWIDAKDD